MTGANGHTYTKNFFDKKGRIIRQEYPNGNVTIKNYDKMGNLISLYTPNAIIKGSIVEEGYRYTYDHMDRLISIKNPLGIIKKI